MYVVGIVHVGWTSLATLGLTNLTRTLDVANGNLRQNTNSRTGMTATRTFATFLPQSTTLVDLKITTTIGRTIVINPILGTDSMMDNVLITRHLLVLDTALHVVEKARNMAKYHVVTLLVNLLEDQHMGLNQTLNKVLPDLMHLLLRQQCHL